MLSTDLFTESWLYKDGLAAGEVKGKAEGKAEGLIDGKRAALRLALKKRFPAMEPPPEIDQVERSEALDELLLAILDAQSVDDARAAVQTALRVN
jgi:hypothetical protein